MFGGTNLQSGYFNDTREWDGTQWTQPTPTSSPASCYWRSMVFDSARNVCVLYVSGVTFEYSVTTPVVASYSPFGSGCSGPSGIPTLSATPGSTPRLGTTLHLQLTNIPASVFTIPFGTFGFSNAAWASYSLPLDLVVLGMPGCTAWMSPDISETLVNAGGTVNWDIAIPNQLYLLNVHFYTQCVVTVPSVNPASLIVSNAGHGVIGTQ